MKFSRRAVFIYVVIAMFVIFFVVPRIFRHKHDALLAELRHETTTEGLAIIQAQSNHLEMVRFDGIVENLENPRGSSTAWISSAGRMVAWNIIRTSEAAKVGCSSPLVVSTIDGSQLWQLPGSIMNVSWIGVADDGLRLAFYGTYKPPGTGVSNSPDNSSQWKTGLQLADFTNKTVSSVALTYANTSVGSISWDPTGNAFVYDQRGQIYVYELSSRTSRLLTEGENPTWSPNGGLVAYKSPAGEAWVIDPQTKRQALLLPKHQILWGVHWSPDSRNVMFSEKTRFLSNILQGYPVLGPSASMVVYSPIDKQSFPVLKFSFKGGDDRGFFWIKDYQAFLAGASIPVNITSCSPDQQWLPR